MDSVWEQVTNTFNASKKKSLQYIVEFLGYSEKTTNVISEKVNTTTLSIFDIVINTGHCVSNINPENALQHHLLPSTNIE